MIAEIKDTNMKIIIRKAKIQDADSIIGFQQAMALETESMMLANEVIQAGVKAVFEDKAKGQYYIAEYEGNVIASLMITFEWSDWRNKQVWWFQSVYVVPEYRRSGIFRKMYDYIKREALNDKAGGLRLYVEKDNIRAQKTYEAMGMDGDHYRFYEDMI